MSIEDELGISGGGRQPVHQPSEPARKSSMCTMLSLFIPLAGGALWLLIGPCGVMASNSADRADRPGKILFVFLIGCAALMPVGLICGIVALVRKEPMKLIAMVVTTIYALLFLAAVAFTVM